MFFKALSQHLSGESEVNYKKPQEK